MGIHRRAAPTSEVRHVLFERMMHRSPEDERRPTTGWSGQDGRLVAGSPERRMRQSRPEPTRTGAVLAMQRLAGNRAVADLLARCRETPDPVVQRTVVTVVGGGTVGSDAGTANHKRDVLAVLDRLHVLWAIDNDGYNTVRAAVLAGDDAVAADTIKTLAAAIDRGVAGTIAPAVAQQTLGVTIGAAVGSGLDNQPDDVRAVGQVLAAEGMVHSEPMSVDTVGAALAELKRRMLSGARPLHPAAGAGGGPAPGGAARPLSLGLVTLSPAERAEVDAAGVAGFAKLPKELRGKVQVEKTLAPAGVNPTKWYGSFVTASFLGNTTDDGRGVHPELQNRLAAAEAALLRLGRAESFGIHLNDKLRGWRPPPGGLHSFGLAADINYATNPLITQATWKAAANADLLVHRVPLANNPITHQGAGLTAPGAAYDLLSHASADLVAYFALKDDGAGLAAAVTALDQAGLNVPARTADQWREQIRADFAAVGPDFQMTGGPMRDPSKGFLDLDRRVVEQLTATGLTWLGGAKVVQDIQHFHYSRGAVKAVWDRFDASGKDIWTSPF